MFFEYGKEDVLNIGQATAWPYYANLADVPQEWKDEVKAGSIFRLMVLSTAVQSGVQVSGLYSWDGVTWRTAAQTNNLNIEHGTTAQRPTNNLGEGRVYFDKTLNKQIYYNGVGWVATADGSAA